jgi:CelD/BcsL family acetyltransferase involved in cellulose biosynthesis
MNVDGRLVSALYGCLFHRRLYLIGSGRDIGYSKYSVGQLHQMEVIREAIGQNLTEFDFLQGDEPYKFYWAKSARRYMRVTVIRRGFLPGLRLMLLRLFLRLWDVRQYSLKEIYAILSIRRRERRELKKMGLAERLNRLRRG